MTAEVSERVKHLCKKEVKRFEAKIMAATTEHDDDEIEREIE